MKKISFLLIIILEIGLIYGCKNITTELKGGLGFTFGSNKETVANIMSSKEVEPLYSGADALICNNYKIGSSNSTKIICLFVDDKLCKISAIFDAETINEVMDLCDYLQEIVASEFGKGKSLKVFSSGKWKPNEALYLLGVDQGKKVPRYFWKLRKKSIITVSIFKYPVIDKLSADLTYENGKLMGTFIKKQDLNK